VPPTLLEDPWFQLPLFERAERVVLLLDYDGTLVPLAPLPHMAVPDRELKDLLRMLAMAPGVALHLVSGRPREWLAEWFDEVPLTLWAEHAFWHRPLGGDWQPAARVSTDWMAGVTPILEQFTATTPGSLVEKKSVSLAWHYRQAEREFGSRQARRLLMLLGDTLSNQPLEVLKGHKVIEVRCRGINKAAVAQALPSHIGSAILAAGDDRTDEDLFGALPESAVTICVGSGPSGARCRLADYRAVRRLLAGVLASRTRCGADRAGSKTGR
jgi:trehalose 6-phosphate synthase/phosphatase